MLVPPMLLDATLKIYRNVFQMVGILATLRSFVVVEPCELFFYILPPPTLQLDAATKTTVWLIHSQKVGFG